LDAGKSKVVTKEQRRRVEGTYLGGGMNGLKSFDSIRGGNVRSAMVQVGNLCEETNDQYEIQVSRKRREEFRPSEPLLHLDSFVEDGKRGFGPRVGSGRLTQKFVEEVQSDRRMT